MFFFSYIADVFQIPDTIVGAILGPRAKTLAEIQHLSGCKVEVHKRGTAAGQGNRLVRFVLTKISRQNLIKCENFASVTKVEMG